MFKKVIDVINNNKSFLITAHMNLEGDALGSELAFYRMLKKLNKEALVYNQDPVPYNYTFLPYSKIIKNEVPRNKKGEEKRFDVGVVLDSSDASRTGIVKDYLSCVRLILNIDHHISNTNFGDTNWIEPTASSASEMVYRICKKLNVIDRDIALCLYTGIFIDTGGFTYANTSYKVHKVIADLLRYGIKPHIIEETLRSLCIPEDLKFIGRIISSLKFDARRKICWAVIENWEEKNYDLTEIIFSIMRLLKSPEVFLLFKKVDEKKIRVNFRSRRRVDVNRIAKFFGGGGHKRASGTTIEGSLSKVEKNVIAFIRRYTNGFVKK